jgi:uncharacterized integral membrane protein
MRLVLPLFALLCAVLGILFGALNPQLVRVDLYWSSVESALGVTLLAALLAGAVLGGMAMLIGVVWPLKSRLRRSRRDQVKRSAGNADVDHTGLMVSSPDKP